MAAPMNGTNGHSNVWKDRPMSTPEGRERQAKDDRRALGQQTVCDAVEDFFTRRKENACSFWRRIRGTVHITIPDFWLMKITMLVIMGFGIYAFGTYTGNWVYSWFV